MDSPAAITEALQALLAGDLIESQDDLGNAAALAPFYPPGELEMRVSCVFASCAMCSSVTLKSSAAHCLLS